ncbi:immunoglobulin domain-containing protein [Flavobacterium sp. ANB]|uniref:immunoglobulin domain-containing protein n=1 Tax=unclassified Flavobacterium TaxID=196869 RepID=UPI0012B903D7|nr:MULTISPECIES: immunoglobulin domain-containing protein [unclassified Flavobacterium]MBF4518095.1 immunoglobulin domain-containing protein [Flavobacterium sp. ANB]MTD71161.1 hypothetical protein [Flavobacterium sp. LC2016-13]
MKKNLFCIWLMLLAILFSVNMEAQMTIGGKKEPEAFSVLELLNKGGLRLPQMTTAERNAFAVKDNDKGNGLTIYNKTTNCVEYWNKVRWVSLCEGTSQTVISPQACLDVAADGTGCDSTFDITDPDCPNGPFNITITAGSEYAALSEVDIVNGKFNINFFPNETTNIHTVLVRVTSTCTSLYKEFLFSQKGVDCNSMTYAAPTITASGTTLCTGGSVYLSVPANSANLDKLIWTRNGIEVARGVNFYIATQKGKYNVSMGAVGCNTNTANEKDITESGTAAPTTISALASNNGVICGTNAVTLSASATTGSVVWFHNGVQEKTGSTVSISGDASVGQWFAAVKDGNCCSKQSNIINVTKSAAAGGQVTITAADVLVNGKPLNSFTSFCSGGSLDLSIINKQSGITYTWYNGNDVIAENPFVVPSSQSTMSLRMVASDNSGAKCPAEASVLEASVTSGNTPGQPNITGNAILCDGTTDLTIVPAVAGTYTYTWYKDNVKMSQTTAAISVSEGGVYSGTVTNATGCTSTWVSRTISSTVSSLPVLSWVVTPDPTKTNFGTKVTMQAAATFNPTSYTWTADNGATVTGTGATVSVQLPASGTDDTPVKITVIAENSCGKSVALEYTILVKNECLTPALTAQSALTQKVTAGSNFSVAVSTTNAQTPTYQWYVNTSASTTGATVISGATAASYTGPVNAAGTYYLFCKVTNGCSGNPTGFSPFFTVTATVNPASITTGSGTFGGRTCFDIAESNDDDDCGRLSTRLGMKSDFNLAATNTQSYVFTPSGNVSNVRFVYVESLTGQIVASISGDNPGAVSGPVTATVVYKTSLSSGANGQGTAFGKTRANALSVTIYAIYTDGTGDKKVELTAQIKDCMCCGAKISPTVWKEFMCYNLGSVDTSSDPMKPIASIQGGTYGWGEFACPAGYRLPTTAEWQGVISNNTATWINYLGNATYYSMTSGMKLGESLMLPTGELMGYGAPNWYPLTYWGQNGAMLNYYTGNGYLAIAGNWANNGYKTHVRCMTAN